MKKDKKYADAILISDLHLTDSIPVSRTDDYISAQIHKLRFIQTLSDKNGNCPILCAGDIFDRWKASPWLCTMAFHYLPKPFITVPGNHDLPMHSLEHYGKSALSLIASVSDQINVLKGEGLGYGNLLITGIPFGQIDEFDVPDMGKTTGRRILILHGLVWKSNRPLWSKGSYTDLELLNKFGNDFDLILTGDNHTTFTTKYKNSWLVNPGSMMRITVDQIDHKPCGYLYYAENNEIKPVYFPIEENVHSKEHIQRKKERGERIAAYIEKISGEWEMGLSFKKNLERFFVKNKIPKKVREIIWRHLETEKI